MKRQSGFTLIELIVVIVILGILAATALPKFSGLSTDARVAKMHGVAAALSGASTMAHGQSLAGQMMPASPVLLEDGTQVDMAFYYPAAAGSSGIAATIDGTGIASAINAANGTWEFYADAGRTTCAVVYHPATGTAAGLGPRVDTASAVAANCM